jgi:hypothetical protein
VEAIGLSFFNGPSERKSMEAAAQQAVAADAQQLVPIDPWYRSGGGRRAPAVAVSAVGRS